MRKVVLRAELRSLAFSACSGIGLFAGFWWEFSRPSPAAPTMCAETSHAPISECFNEGLLTTLVPYIVAMGLGLLAGTFLGVLLIRVLLPARRLSAAPQAGSASGRWLIARYEGRCLTCRTPISVGDRIVHSPNFTRCSACGVGEQARGG